MTPIEKEIEVIVDGILEDYRHGRDIDKLDPFQHPDKAVVIDMIGKLLRIVYPAFFVMLRRVRLLSTCFA